MLAVIDHQGRIALLLRVTPRSRKAVVIMLKDNMRALVETKIDDFKKKWMPIDYDVHKLAAKWLDFEHYIPITHNARKELAMITIESQTFSSPEELAALTGKRLAEIHNQVFGTTMDRARDKDKVADKIYTTLEIAQAAPPIEKKVIKPVIEKRPSVKAALRILFSELIPADGYTLIQLEALTGGTEVSIKTAISDLKNPKYSGGPIVNIIKTKEGGYNVA